MEVVLVEVVLVDVVDGFGGHRVVVLDVLLVGPPVVVGPAVVEVVDVVDVVLVDVVVEVAQLDSVRVQRAVSASHS